MKYIGIQSQIRSNNIRSTVLLILFPGILLGLTWLFFYILVRVTQGEYDYSGMEMAYSNTMFVEALPWVLGACGLWFIIAYFANTTMIKAATGSRTLSRKDNKRVYNLVENLCMANGMSMPKVNVIEDDSLNAFASGISQKTYTVTLSRGLINKLDDDELEGVIAHELTHIRNRDVRLLIVSIIFVGIFSFLTSLLLRSAFISSMNRRSDNKGGGAAIMLIAFALAAVGYLITILLRFAISRKREYMADAGGAQMTKKPWALASALRKISGDSRIEAVTREDVAQLFIEHPAKSKSKSDSGIFSLFATHPPIKKRIALLEQF